jgi:hypothetical protein
MVQTNNYAPQAGVSGTYDQDDPFALIAGGKGGKAISFNLKDAYGNNQTLPIGTAFTGVLEENITVTAVLKYGTKDPDFYPDGNPKKQIRALLNSVLVSLPDQAGGQWQDVRVLNSEQDDDDEGKRALYFKNQMKQALDDAMKVAGVPNFGVGTRITVRMVDMKASNNPNYNAQKLYEVTLSEVQPYVPAAVVQATAELQGALHQGAQAVPQQAAPAVPVAPPLQSPVPAQFPSAAQQQAAAQPVQYANPAQPTFPGQVVPVPQQAPQVAPAIPQQVAAAIPQAAPAVPQQQVAPAAPAGAPIVTAEMVQQVEMVIQQGIPRDQAIDGVANLFAAGNAEFRSALDQSVPF